ncbi:MAG: ribonuclease III [Ruminococcaceae bacterium]|nr:ribonuclease III [Oscillospiraceae bacterium]
MRFTDNKCDPENLSPLMLAFIGDTVYDLFVRETLLTECPRPVKKLHALAVEEVSASAQARKIKEILHLLTEEETDIFKRGRNAHTGHVPKSADVVTYHHATGLETLFGYLYLKGNIERLKELFEEIHKI